jgi:hypothetical protein
MISSMLHVEPDKPYRTMPNPTMNLQVPGCLARPVPYHPTAVGCNTPAGVVVGQAMVPPQLTIQRQQVSAVDV